MKRFWPRFQYQDWGFYTPALSPTVRVLLIINVVVYIVRVQVNKATGGAFDIIFGLSEYIYRDGFIWQAVSYMFLHGSLLHMLFNMLVLYFIGVDIERAMGPARFVLLYFTAGILGGLGWLILAPPGGVCIGASGAVFGLLGAFAAMFPNRLITLLVFFVIPVTMRAWVMALVLAALEFTLMMTHVVSGIAHSAHLAGMVAGFVYATVVMRRGIRIRIIRNRREPRLNVLRREDAPVVSPEEVDRILDKIAHEGMGSLSASERKLLEQASLDRKS
jgi:membrane associated rhomboid family serine protease